MPFYIYSCPGEGCRETEMVFHPTIPREKPKAPPCPSHDLFMERDFHLEHTNHMPASVFPFLHPHLTGTGEPILITSENHYRETCKRLSLERYGVPDAIVPRPDKAFIDEQVIINDRGERQKVEGSGLGHKGCWTSIPKLLTQSPEEIEEFFKRG